MSGQVDQFCDALRDQLNVIEDRVQSVKANLEALPEQAEKAVRAKLEQARANMEAQKERVDQALAPIWRLAPPSGLQRRRRQSISGRRRRETAKLQTRAEVAEAYAADAIEFAVATISEAEAAMLDAVVARMDADTVQ